MGMRITTNMMMNTYRFNLQGSTKNLADSRDSVLTHRKFDSYAEDPAAATQAWRIRRAMASNYDYQANNSDTYSRFNIAWTSMGVVVDALEDKDGRFSTIRGVNGTAGAGRQPLGKVLNDSAETIINTMNSSKYNSHYVFSGDDEMNPPFSWSDDMKTLYYRGINVNAGAVKKPVEPDWTSNPLDANGTPAGMPTTGADAWEKSWVQYYQDQAKDPPAGVAKPQEVPDWANNKLDATGMPEGMPDENAATTTDWEKEWIAYFKDQKANPNPANQTVERPAIDVAADDTTNKWGEKDQYGVPANAKSILEDPNSTAKDKAWAEYYLDQGDLNKLHALAKETEYVDLGMGLAEDENDVLINGTAFDRSLPGIAMLGYGVDEDGDPKNAVLIMKRLGELLGNADPSSGAWDPDKEKAEEIHTEAMRLLDKLTNAHHSTIESYVDIETKSHFLQQNQSRLELQGDYLQEERVNLEQVDLADAITEFSWDYYCYSAALKIGTQLLSQSLLDYMN